MSKKKQPTARQRVYAHIKSHGPVPFRSLVEDLGLSDGAVGSAINSLKGQGYVGAVGTTILSGRRVTLWGAAKEFSEPKREPSQTRDKCVSDLVAKIRQAGGGVFGVMVAQLETV